MHAPRFTSVIACGGALIASIAAAGQAHADTLVRPHTDPSKSGNYSVHLHVDNLGQCSQYAHQGAVVGDNFWAFDPHTTPGIPNCYLLESSIPEIRHWPRGSYDVFAV